jgi:hypothetical protein
MSVHVASPATGTRLDVDGVALPLPDDGDVLVWHVPGTATIRVRAPSGVEQSRVVSVQAGSDTRQDFDVRDAPAPVIAPPPIAPIPTKPPEPEAPTEPPRGRPWAVPGALVSGGVGLVGLGVFAGFGLSSHQSFTDLNRRCGPHACGDAERSEIDRGRRNQVIANTGLVIGIVGTAAAITFVVLRVTAPRQGENVAKSTRLVLGLGTAALHGSFD